MLGAILAGGAIASSITQAGTSIANTALNQKNFETQMKFNENQAQLNRDFQKEMAQNNIKYAVDQAKELGISPSLVLGDQTNSLGGSQASVGNAPSLNTSGVGQIGNILGKIYELNTLKEMNEDKLDTFKDIQALKMSNSTNKKVAESTTEYAKRNGYNSYNQFEKSLYSDLNNLEL